MRFYLHGVIFFSSLGWGANAMKYPAIDFDFWLDSLYPPVVTLAMRTFIDCQKVCSKLSKKDSIYLNNYCGEKRRGDWEKCQGKFNAMVAEDKKAEKINRNLNPQEIYRQFRYDDNPFNNGSYGTYFRKSSCSVTTAGKPTIGRINLEYQFDCPKDFSLTSYWVAVYNKEKKMIGSFPCKTTLSSVGVKEGNKNNDCETKGVCSCSFEEGENFPISGKKDGKPNKDRLEPGEITLSGSARCERSSSPTKKILKPLPLNYIKDLRTGTPPETITCRDFSSPAHVQKGAEGSENH